MMGKIRRMYFRDKLSLHQIAKRTGLSRNTIRKWVRAPEATQPAYLRCATSNKLSPFHQTLEQALKADSFRAKHNRRSAKALFEQIKAEGWRMKVSRSPPPRCRQYDIGTQNLKPTELGGKIRSSKFWE
jgi:transposase-like protein